MRLAFAGCAPNHDADLCLNRTWPTIVKLGNARPWGVTFETARIASYIAYCIVAELREETLRVPKEAQEGCQFDKHNN